MTEIEYRISDLINFSSNQKPVEFEIAFRGIIAQKVADAIEDRKRIIATSVLDTDEVEIDDDQLELDYDETENSEE